MCCAGLALKASAEPDELLTDRLAEIGRRGFFFVVEHALGLSLLTNALIALALEFVLVAVHGFFPRILLLLHRYTCGGAERFKTFSNRLARGSAMIVFVGKFASA